jgi:hypothetical protein
MAVKLYIMVLYVVTPCTLFAGEVTVHSRGTQPGVCKHHGAVLISDGALIYLYKL